MSVWRNGAIFGQTMLVIYVAFACSAGCIGSVAGDGTENTGTLGDPDGGAGDSGGGSDGGGNHDAGLGDSSGGGTGLGLCGQTPPVGATLAPPPPAYSGERCPDLADGVNQLRSGGGAREFLLVVPDTIQPLEKLPVVFLWHWLNSDAQSFYEEAEIRPAVNALRFIAVIPQSKQSSVLDVFDWPFSLLTTQPRIDEEMRFFDDMLACVSEQFPVNRNCVSSMGASAGALFTSQLAGYRGQYLSSIVVLSGGTGGLIRNWVAPTHKMPALVLWGGPSDQCVVINFEQTSRDLETGLRQGNHFVVECIHNCGHGEPPLDGTATDATRFDRFWRFIVDHPYWLSPGQSPYATDGLPDEFPAWCEIGTYSATIRQGQCPPNRCGL